jgi:hypothetical protein
MVAGIFPTRASLVLLLGKSSRNGMSEKTPKSKPSNKIKDTPKNEIFSRKIEGCRRSLRSEGKSERIKMKPGLESLHWVGGADGLPEDGVRPANLVAEPPQCVPHRHLLRRPDARKDVRQTLAPPLQGPPPPAPQRGTRDGANEQDRRRLTRRRSSSSSWPARPASCGARRPSLS